MTPQALQKLIAGQTAAYYDVVIPEFEVTYPEGRFGDYSANVAFKLAKTLKRSPVTLADELAAEIKHVDIAKVEAVGGYLNITMKPSFWAMQLQGIGTKYGWVKADHSQKIQVEFISANPTGPLTLANARGGFLGDVLANVLISQGHDVTREHYLNDAGGQIGKLVQSIRIEAGETIEGERQYSGDYIKGLAETIKPSVEESDKELGQKAVSAITEMIKHAVERMGISFDVWFNEQSLIDDGTVQKVLDYFEEHKLTYKKDGAVWLRSESLGDARDRVLVKSDGEYIYLLNDIGYHANIFNERKFDKAVKIWGADHGGQVDSLRVGVKQIAPKAKLDFILLQLVRIMKDGQEFKSSKRAGTFITMDELIDEVGADVARFLFLLRSADSQMDFDLGLAKEQSAQNPLYYVMYSYARAQSILRKAVEAQLKPEQANYSEPTELETELIKKMTQWPELLAQIAGDYQVQKLTHYGIELATVFQKLYEQAKILSLPEEEATGKLYLINQFVGFMEDYFAVLGLTPQATMTREPTDDSSI